MSNYLNSTPNPDRFVYFNRINNCPICQSDNRKCRSKGDLYYCMSDVEPDLSQWKSRGETKNRQWRMWVKAENAHKKPPQQSFKQSNSSNKQRALSLNLIDRIYRYLQADIGLDDRSRSDLTRRGINPDEYLGFSVQPGKLDYSDIVKKWGLEATLMFPGHGFNFPGYGYTVPVFDSHGRIIGYQVRYFDLDNRYSWVSNPKILVGDDNILELPLTYIKGNNQAGTIYLTEGLLKPWSANQRLGISVIGAAGGMIASSLIQLTKVLTETNPTRVVWAVDGGAIKNRSVITQYLRASKLIKQIAGIDVEYLWYGQTDKGNNDIDEINIETFDNAQYLSESEFIGLTKDYIDVDFENNFEVDTNAPQFTKADTQNLYITDNTEIFTEYQNDNKSVIYCPKFQITSISESLLDDDVLGFENIVFVHKDRDNYEPWLSAVDCSKLRFVSNFTSRALGLKPIGSMDNEPDKKAFLGLEQSQNPLFAHPDKLMEEKGQIWRDKQGHEPVKLLLQTKKGPLPLAAVAYNGVVPKLINPDRETTGKYFPRIDLVDDAAPYCFGSILGMQGDMGTGKTTEAVELVNQQSDIYGIELGVTVISPTINLSRQLSEKIPNCIALNDYKGIGLNESEFATIINANRIGLCFNSLYQFKDRVIGEGHTLILDEVESQLESFLDPHSHFDPRYKSANRATLANKIREVLEKDGIVLVMDANLKDITLVKLAELAGVPKEKIVRIVHKKDEPDSKWTIVDNHKEWVRLLLDYLEIGMRIALPTDSKDFLKKLELATTRMGINAIYYHQETVAHPDLVGFAENPNKFLEEHNPQLFAYSPSAATGFDITYNEFDFVFPRLFGVVKPDTARQLPARIRDVNIPRIGCINEKAIGQAPMAYKPSDILADELKAINGTLSAVGLDGIEFSQNPLTDLRALHLAKQAYQFYNYKDAVIGGLLVNQNCRIVEYNSSDCEHDLLKKEKKELENIESDSIARVEALDLSSPAFKKLDSLAYKTLNERSQWIKSRILDRLPGLNVDKDFALAHMVSSTGRNRMRALGNLGDSLYDDVSIEIARDWMFNRLQDIKNGKADNLLMLDITARARKNKTLANLGIAAVIQHICTKQVEDMTNCLQDHVTISLEDEPVKLFLDRFIKNQGHYSKVLGLNIKPGLSRAKKLQRLLRLVGISLTNPKALVGTPMVQIKLPYDLIGILIAHYNGLQNRLDKLEHDGNSPRDKLGERYDTTPLKALLDKVLQREKVDNLLLIKELNLFFYGCNTKRREGKYTTNETKHRDIGKSPPVEVG